MIKMKNCKRKFYQYIILIIGILSYGLAQDTVVELSIGNIDEEYGTFDVLYNSQEDIYNFQLEIHEEEKKQQEIEELFH